MTYYYLTLYKLDKYLSTSIITYKNCPKKFYTINYLTLYWLSNIFMTSYYLTLYKQDKYSILNIIIYNNCLMKL